MEGSQKEENNNGTSAQISTHCWNPPCGCRSDEWCWNPTTLYDDGDQRRYSTLTLIRIEFRYSSLNFRPRLLYLIHATKSSESSQKSSMKNKIRKRYTLMFRKVKSSFKSWCESNRITKSHQRKLDPAERWFMPCPYQGIRNTVRVGHVLPLVVHERFLVFP